MPIREEPIHDCYDAETRIEMLDSLVLKAEHERDEALARVKELEKKLAELEQANSEFEGFKEWYRRSQDAASVEMQRILLKHNQQLQQENRDLRQIVAEYLEHYYLGQDSKRSRESRESWIERCKRLEKRAQQLLSSSSEVKGDESNG